MKRDDLPVEYRDLPGDDLQREHLVLAPELVQQADMIVFVEGKDIKFLKHLPGIQSQDSIDVLMRYVTSTEPMTKLLPARAKRPYRKKAPEPKIGKAK